MVDKVLHSQMPFTTGGQTINDRLTAAYHSLAGSQIGKTVCKATTEESIGPKKKHLDYLLHCTHEPNVSIPQLANALVERTTNQNWCVVYKALITIHNVMCYGNERFCQYLASSNANFNLGNFLDKTSMQGYDMSTHVRRYAKYISEKVYTYRMVAFDFCKVKRGREDGFLRVMAIDKLLKTLPLLQGQIDALLEFQVTQTDLTNGVINCSFLLMFRDLIRLFACYNDGIINLLEKYFEMNKKQCAESLDLYKKFVERMDKVAEFLKVAETVGVDKGEIPDLVRAPGSLLESLENHLASMEGQKGSGGTTGGRVTSPVSGTFQPFANFNDQNRDPFFESNSIDESSKRKIIQEEEYRMNALKEQKLSNQNSRSSDVDLFSPNVTVGRLGRPPNMNDTSAFIANNQKVNAIDDLLSLDAPQVVPPSSTNPFATDVSYQPNIQLQAPFPTPWSVSPTPGYTNGRVPFSNTAAPNGRSFADENAFAKAFGSPPKSSSSGYGEYSSDYQVSGGLSQYAPSSRGISPAPEEEMGRNPFLTDAYDSGFVAPGESNRNEPVMTAAGEWHTGYDQEPVSKYEQPNVGDIAPASFNPFAPSQTQQPLEMNSLDIGVGQLNFGKSPAVSAISSALGSPSSVASPMRAFSQPMGIQQPSPAQNVYPNLGGYDSNYPAGGAPGQYPRFMTPPPQPRAASSYGGPSVFEAEMNSSGDQWARPPARPPSAPPTELQGLDPLGDLLTPQPTFAAAPVSLTGPPAMGQQQRRTNEKLLKGDLDSSLASLAENLSIGKGPDSLKKPVQWTGSGKPGQNTAPVQTMNWNAPPSAVPGYGGMPYQQPQQQQAWGGQQPAMGGMMMGAPMQAPYGQPRPQFGAQQMVYPGGQLSMGGGYGMAPAPNQMPMYGQQQPRMMTQQQAGQDPFGGL